MKRTIPFIKAHGCENSFVLLDLRRERLTNLRQAALTLCDKRTGIGADGLLILGSSRRADFRMLYYNADGSRGEMCGNGIRCLALLVRSRGISKARTVSFETGAGIIQVSYAGNDRGVSMFKVDMGRPRFRSPDFRVTVRGSGLQELTLRRRRYALVSMGNPHAIAFVSSQAVDPALEGPPIEQRRKLFPHGTNVEFAQVQSKSVLRVRVWERGCGVTRACGTGACAAVVAAIAKGLLPRRPVRVVLDGGELRISWDQKTDSVFMTGPAVVVAQGRVTLLLR